MENEPDFFVRQYKPAGSCTKETELIAILLLLMFTLVVLSVNVATGHAWSFHSNVVMFCPMKLWLAQ